MSKLFEHFKAMQALAGSFIEPNGAYKSRNGTEYSNGEAKPGEYGLEETAFINDMIYMLDGPEQREAEEAEAERQAGIDHLTARVEELRDKLAVADSDRKRATDKLDVVKKECNDLRDRLMDSELAHARLRGYLERVEDERPVEMVPAPRERFLAQRDGTALDLDSFNYAANYGRQDAPRRWYHR